MICSHHRPRSAPLSSTHTEEGERVATCLKNVRGSGPPLFITVQGQHRGGRNVATSGRRRWTEEEGARAVLPDYGRDDLLVPTLMRRAGGVSQRQGHREGMKDRFAAALLAWHRRLHAPGWEGNCSDGGAEESAPDGREAQPGSTIMRRTERVLQRRADHEGWKRKAPTLSAGCPLCADDSYASDRGGVTARREPGLIL